VEKAVIDASIIVKWFVEESGSKDALSIRDRYVEGTLEIIAPSLLHYEVLNTLHFKGLFTPLELHDASSALDSYSFDLRQLNGEYAKAALRIASAHSISLYDASYVALACMERRHSTQPMAGLPAASQPARRLGCERQLIGIVALSLCTVAV